MNVRPMMRAKRRIRKSDAKFVGMVAVVAVAAFAATMMWPRGGDVQPAYAAGAVGPRHIRDG